MGITRDLASAIEPGGIDKHGLSEFAEVGGGYAVWTRRRPHHLGDHAHASQWEIHYLVHGQICETVAGVTYIMNGGDVMVAPPGVTHSGINRVRHRCGLFWLGVRMDPRRNLPGLTPKVSTEIRRSFQSLGTAPFAGDVGLLPAFAGLLRESLARAPQRELLCRSHLHAILALVARGGDGRSAPRSRELSPPVARAVELLRQRLDIPQRMDALSAEVGLGKSALHERFVAEAGMAPAEMHMQLRLEEAKAMVLTSTNAIVAARLGFSSPQHFITAFKLAFGLTPGAWKIRGNAS